MIVFQIPYFLLGLIFLLALNIKKYALEKPAATREVSSSFCNTRTPSAFQPYRSKSTSLSSMDGSSLSFKHLWILHLLFYRPKQITLWISPPSSSFPFLLPPSLRVNHCWPGPSRAVFAGLAGRRWRRRGVGVDFRIRSRFSGCLPAFRSRETRSLAKIWFIWRWNCGGELQWLEQARWLFCSGISFNKGPSRRLSVCRRLVAALLLLAGRGDRGEKHGGVGAFSNLCFPDRPW